MAAVAPPGTSNLQRNGFWLPRPGKSGCRFGCLSTFPAKPLVASSKNSLVSSTVLALPTTATRTTSPMLAPDPVFEAIESHRRALAYRLAAIEDDAAFHHERKQLA